MVIDATIEIALGGEIFQMVAARDTDFRLRTHTQGVWRTQRTGVCRDIKRLAEVTHSRLEELAMKVILHDELEVWSDSHIEASLRSRDQPFESLFCEIVGKKGHIPVSLVWCPY